MHEELALASLELKAAPDAATGEFTGYGAIFGNVDSHGDTITPGAFRDSIAGRKNRPLPMHLNHGLPAIGGLRGVGVWSALAEDSRGLEVKGKISGMSTDAGRLLYERVKDGAFAGLSIGYVVPPGGAVLGKAANGARRTLNRLDLVEVSLVDNPSNADALLHQVKSAWEGKAARTDATGAAESVAAAMRLHDKAMAPESYESRSPRAQAQLMEHLRDAHQKLTGSRAPADMDTWVKSGPTPAEIKAALVAAGMPEAEAEALAAQGRKSVPVSGLGELFGGFGGFSLA